MRKDNFTEVLKRFLYELKIPVTDQGINNELQMHPEYDSFIAISDVLNTWLVPNAAYQLTFDELLGAEIEDPFIAFISDKEFVVVSHLDKNYAVVSNEKWNNHKLTIAEFEEIYSGSILVAEKETTSGEINYIENHRKEIYNRLITPIVLLGGVMILFAFLIAHLGYITKFSWYTNLLILLKTAGLGSVSLLVIQSYSADSPIFQKLCGSAYHNDCNPVLSSKGAKIYDVITWSEIGLFYFGGSWLVLMFNSNNMALLQLLGLLNLISLPFTFYFIYYQWRVVKEWCILCCIVHALLWLELVVFFPLISKGLLMPNLITWVNLAIGMVIPIVLWTLVKPYLLSSKKLKPYTNELRDFKYNRDVYQASLNESVKYGLVADEDSIILGNPQAENTVTVVLKPYGKLSADAYKGLNWLAAKDDVRLQIIFATTSSDPDMQVATYILALKRKLDNVSLKKAIDSWYTQKRKNYDDWKDEHPVYKVDNAQDTIKVNSEWCQMADVNKIPTIFINGQKLKLNYKTSDLKYFI
jgi:uncharacterized membrane protein